jgi:hypothetical protein|tara:strand:- start:1043 stop:1660 length:618 start_codon:yes stop_codon:yes gene_type:complete
MGSNEDNIILLPITVFLYDRLNTWSNDNFIRFKDKDYNTVFEGDVSALEYRNMYNISLKEGKYSVHLDSNIKRHLVSWDIYINDNGVLKNICSSDNFKCEINTDCDPDTFILSLSDYSQKNIINGDTAKIKSASIDELQVNSIQFSNVPFKLGLEKIYTIYNDKIYHLSYGGYKMTRKFSYAKDIKAFKNKSKSRKLLYSYSVKK